MASFSVDLIGCVFISAISESAFPAELFHIGLISGALTRLAIWFLFWQMADRNLSISLVWKYTWVYKLTLWMLNGLVEKVEVYNAEKWTVCGSRGFVSTITMWEKAHFLKYYPCQFLMWPSIPRRECSLTASRLKSLDKNNKNECSYSFSNAVGTLVMIWGGRLQRHPSWWKVFRYSWHSRPRPGPETIFHPEARHMWAEPQQLTECRNVLELQSWVEMRSF